MPPKTPCGNPLYLKWIEELRDQARDKGSKAFESYSKAARSLASCPVHYPRPRDLVVLVGIGPKTISILESKWKKHCEENGLPNPGSPSKRPADESSKRTMKKGATSFDFGSDDGTGSEAETPVAPPAKKRKAAKPKTYIPQHGSGGYGLLLGLVLAIENPLSNTQVFLTKSELTRNSQPYSDASYDHSEKGTYFTAWNSMKTLVNRGYIYVTGNPHKYCLTEEGYEVACAIRALRPEFKHIEKTPFLHGTVDPVGLRAPLGYPTAPQVALTTTTYDTSPAPSPAESSMMAQKRQSPAGKFQFWYIDSLGRRVETVSEAMVRLDPEDFITLRKIEMLDAQRSHAFVGQLRLVDSSPVRRDGQSTLYAYLVEETAPPKCSKFGTCEPIANSDIPDTKDSFPQAYQTGRALKAMDTATSDDDWVGQSQPVSFAKARLTSNGMSRTLSTEMLTASATSSSMDGLTTGRATKGEGSAQLSKIERSSLPNASLPGPRLSSHVQPAHPLAVSSHSLDTVNIPDFDPSKGIIFPAGSYEIILVLDTREIESKSNRDRFSEQLAEKGVKLETRALRLGDVCWVAKRLDGIGGEEDECVLDYVLERKRLDDLCSSMRDGRYHEQCFRLSNSGIANIYYLIEDWQTSHHMEFSGLQIMTAKSQIQVHNRFNLKETKKLSESIDFLATMTGVIKKRLSTTDLHVIPTRFLSRSSYLPLRAHLKSSNPETVWHTSFQAYQDINDKSASSTLRDKWARMLLCIKGMSAERASAVIDQFETPRDMWTALKERVKEAQREESQNQSQSLTEGSLGETSGKAKKGKSKIRGPDLFFADRVQGDGRRKIGDALSREMYKIFMGGLGQPGV